MLLKIAARTALLNLRLKPEETFPAADVIVPLDEVAAAVEDS
jgi:hypothetical protein